MESQVQRIFVFGSNLAGQHAGGAALHASKHYGAEWGVGEGRTGQSYALPTKEHNVRDARSLGEVAASVNEFLAHAAANPDEIFYVTRIGCGLAGFTDAEIAPLFLEAPANCEFDPLWAGYGLPSFTEVM